MKNTRKGFTLVELIVVITILAILGSIAFVSLQGYSADARNSKRTSDLNSLQNAMSVKSTEGASIMSFISGSDKNLDDISIGWKTPETDEYAANIPNYSALGVKQADFQDPLSNADYLAGATSLKLGQYELAASMEQGSGNQIAKIVGNYKPRTQEDVTGTSTASGTFKIASSEINSFFVGDIIEGGSATGRITSISADGLQIKFIGNATWNIQLNDSESDWLIKSKDTSDAVTDGSQDLPY